MMGWKQEWTAIESLNPSHTVSPTSFFSSFSGMARIGVLGTDLNPVVQRLAESLLKSSISWKSCVYTGQSYVAFVGVCVGGG